MNHLTRTRVLVASDYYSPHWTGIVKALECVITALQDEVEFTVLTSRYSKSLPAETAGKVRIIRAEPLCFVSRGSFSLAAIAKFIRLVKVHDTILINSPCSNILPYALIAKLAARRLIIFHQGDLKLREGLFNRLIELAFRACTATAMACADVVSTFTEDYAEHSPLMRNFLKRFRPLLVPIQHRDPPHRYPDSVQPVLDLKRSGKSIFGFAGRFVHEKGFDILFDAIPEVLKHIPEAHFVFAGEMKIAYEDFFSETAEKYERVKSKVTLLGLLPESEIWSFYHAIDFILIPSRTDCFNLVQVEACLCGKPCVVTDIPGARQLVVTTGFGRVARSENAADFADSIVTVLQTEETIRGKIENVKRFLDYDRATQSWREVLAG